MPFYTAHKPTRWTKAYSPVKKLSSFLWKRFGHGTDRFLHATITLPLAWNFRLRPYNSKNTDPNETWGHRYLVCGFKSRPDGVVPLLVKSKGDLSFRILSVLVLFLALLLHMNCFVNSYSFDFVGQAKRSWNKKNQNSLQFCSFQENENQNSRAPICNFQFLISEIEKWLQFSFFLANKNFKSKIKHIDFQFLIFLKIKWTEGTRTSQQLALWYRSMPENDFFKVSPCLQVILYNVIKNQSQYRKLT